MRVVQWDMAADQEITEVLTVAAPDPELAETLAVAAVSGDGDTVVEEVLAVDPVDARSFRVTLRARTSLNLPVELEP